MGEPTMAPVRVGLLGAGRIAQSAHLPAIAHAPSVNLVGLFDPSDYLRETVARRYEVTAYPTSQALLDDPSIDAVIIAVPDRFHAATTVDALEAGKHVLVEKPLAPTVAEAESVVDAARRSAKIVQVGSMKRHDPGVRFAAHVVRERLGRILTATLWYRVMSALRPATEATFFPMMVVDPAVRAVEAAHRSDRAAYLLATHGAHVFDTLRHLCGDPASLMVRHAQVGDDHAWHGLATLRDGGVAHLEIVANVHAEWSEGAIIHGERGSVTIRTPFPVSLQASFVEAFDEATALTERPAFGDTNPYKLQVEAFARAIQTGANADPDAEAGLAAVRLIEAAARSAASGGVWVTP
jgi:predicted dehydrogenase